MSTNHTTLPGTWLHKHHSWYMSPHITSIFDQMLSVYISFKLGVAEIFQGQEKPVMIVSVVRGGGQGLGFVSDPQVR